MDKTITIGRQGCDIIINDPSISRYHARISLVAGQYVYNDVSRNGTVINGQYINNTKVVITPESKVFLANKVPLPWAQIFMLLPNGPVVAGSGNGGGETVIETVTPISPVREESIGAGWGIVAFLFPIIGFILYFVWKDTEHHKAKQASNIAWISIGISFAIGFISGIAASM